MPCSFYFPTIQRKKKSWGYTLKQRLASVVITMTSALKPVVGRPHYPGTQGQMTFRLSQFTFRKFP